MWCASADCSHLLVWAVRRFCTERRPHAEEVSQWRFTLMVTVTRVRVDGLGWERMCSQNARGPYHYECRCGCKQRAPRDMASDGSVLARKSANALLEQISAGKTHSSRGQRPPGGPVGDAQNSRREHKRRATSCRIVGKKFCL